MSFSFGRAGASPATVEERAPPAGPAGLVMGAFSGPSPNWQPTWWQLLLAGLAELL
jgi:hypothetical protein